MLKLAAALFLLAPTAPVAPTADDLATLQDAFTKARTVEARSELLGRIAALHTDVNSVEVTSAIAAGLQDEGLVVRALAAQLLSSGVDQEIAVAALTAGMGDLVAHEKAVWDLMDEKVETGIGTDRSGNTVVDAEKMNRLLERMDRQVTLLKAVVPYQKAMIEAVAGYRDDRCVEALGALLDSRPPARGDELFKLLIDYGTAPALTYALGSIEGQEDLLAARKKDRSKLARQRAASQPKYWRGTKKAWKQAEKERIAKAVARFDEQTAKVEEYCKGQLEHLRAFALDRALAATPSKLDSRAWSRWLKKVRHLLPESLDG